MTVFPRTPPRNSLALWAALIVSVLVHLAIFVMGTLGVGQFAQWSSPSAFLKTENEIVTITNPLIIQRAAATPPPVVAPRSPRRRFAGIRAPRGLFEAQLKSAASVAGHRAAAPTHPVVTLPDPATAPLKYQLTMRGKSAKLKHGQGIYFPTRGWRQDGQDYYDASYEYVYPNGTDEKGTVPWPIHFDPSSDPFFSSDPEALSKTPMPGPPPGFVPPGDLGKALRAYFPNLHFEDSDN